MKKNWLFKFFASLKLAVFCILSLAGILAWATVLESEYGMRGAHVLVYGQWWFAGVLFLLALNVLCAAIIRYPWKKHQTGFVITHLGILVLLAGSAMTQRWGVDGNLPVVEGERGNGVQLNEQMLVFYDEGGQIVKEIPVPETAVRAAGDLLNVRLSENRSLRMTEYLPRVVAKRDFVPSPLEGVGQPAINVELFNSRFRLSEWLKQENPEKAAELNLGPAIVSFRKLWNREEEKNFLQPEKGVKEKSPKASAGVLVVHLDGKQYRLDVKDLLQGWKSLTREGGGVEIKVERYLPFAVVENNQLVSKSDEPGNPALQILARRGDEVEPERHTIFALYPEFNTLHKSKVAKRTPIGLRFQFVSARSNERLAGVGTNRGKLDFALTSDGRVLYRSFAAQGKLNSSGEAKAGQEVMTGWMDLKFTLKQILPSAVEQENPRYVEYIEGQGANFASAVKIGLATPNGLQNERWLLEGQTENIDVGGQTWLVQFTRRRIFLPFALFLEKFTVGTDPGTQKAASYESRVTVNDESLNAKKSALISMNEPLKHGGYTFYQASYQMEEGRPPLSIFSVNFDPGRAVKYAGSIIMVLGIIIMFYMNPHYWGKMMGKRS